VTNHKNYRSAINQDSSPESLIAAKTKLIEQAREINSLIKAQEKRLKSLQSTQSLVQSMVDEISTRFVTRETLTPQLAPSEIEENTRNTRKWTPKEVAKAWIEAGKSPERLSRILLNTVKETARQDKLDAKRRKEFKEKQEKARELRRLRELSEINQQCKTPGSQPVSKDFISTTISAKCKHTKCEKVFYSKTTNEKFALGMCSHCKTRYVVQHDNHGTSTFVTKVGEEFSLKRVSTKND
jgi:hypothetical protein